MTKTVTSARVTSIRDGRKVRNEYYAGNCNGQTGVRQSAMRRASIDQANGFAVTVTEFYDDGTSFDFVYPSPSGVTA